MLIDLYFIMVLYLHYLLVKIALCEENPLLHQKIERLESQISVLETDLNKQDQYSRRNNLDIQGIPDSVSDDQLKKRSLRFSIKSMLKLINLILRTVTVWVSRRK